MKNTIANLITIIRMGAQAKRRTVGVENTVFARKLLLSFYENGLIAGFSAPLGTDKYLKVYFRYSELRVKHPLSSLIQLSSPGFRRYCNYSHICRLSKKYDYIYINTSAGLLTNKQLFERSLKIGGEVICCF
jgi:ribosomal protein S8